MTTTTRNGTAKTRPVIVVASGADSERLGTGVTKPTHRELMRKKREKAEKHTTENESPKKSDDENTHKGGGDELPTSFYI
jgi:hypothetical protein